MAYRCEICGEEIPTRRVVVILERTGEIPTRCVKHSDVRKYVGIMVYPHKTGGDTMVVDPRNKEALRRAIRFSNRER